MAGSSTILIANEDLSVVGSETTPLDQRSAADVEDAFFQLIEKSSLDVLVFDFRRGATQGVSAILRVRRRCFVPVLVLCDADDPYRSDYTIAGASDYLTSPFDVLQFNAAVQKIIAVYGRREAAAAPPPRVPIGKPSSNLARTYYVGGMTFRPQHNELIQAGQQVKLTTAENQLMLFLISRPWIACTRSELAAILYDRHRPISERAIDIIVTRIRRKIAAISGEEASRMIKTEYRRGYMLVADVEEAAAPSSTPVLQAAQALA